MAAFVLGSGKENYQEIVTHYCGSSWGLLCNIVIVILNICTCVTLILIFGDMTDIGELIFDSKT